MRIHRTLALTFVLLCAPYIAESSPIRVSFAGLVDQGIPGDPLDGFGISGFFVYDDLFGGIGMTQPPPAGCGLNCDSFGNNSPVLDFLLNVGQYRFTFADVEAGSFVHGVIGNQFWGPYIGVKPTSLPVGLGLTSLGLGTAGSTVEFLYSTPNFTTFFTLPFTYRPVPVSVPEPASLLLMSGAIAALLLKKKKGSPR